MTELNRRDALRTIAIGGAAVVTAPLWVETLVAAAGQHAAHYQAATAPAAWVPRALSAAQNETVVVLAELIIPQTDTAGATKANVNRFVDAVLADASAADRQKFIDGLAWVDTQSQRDAGVPFARAGTAHQVALLTAMNTNKAPSAAERAGVEFFKAIKSLTITGYYTSEVGMREEMGDDGNMFFLEFKGCTHPEHKA